MAYCKDLTEEMILMETKHMHQTYKMTFSEMLTGILDGSWTMPERLKDCWDTISCSGMTKAMMKHFGVYDEVKSGIKIKYKVNVPIGSRKHKKVICLETGETWPSLISCCKDLGTTKPVISRVIHKNGGLYKGRHYQFANITNIKKIKN